MTAHSHALMPSFFSGSGSLSGAELSSAELPSVIGTFRLIVSLDLTNLSQSISIACMRMTFSLFTGSGAPLSRPTLPRISAKLSPGSVSVVLPSMHSCMPFPPFSAGRGAVRYTVL